MSKPLVGILIAVAATFTCTRLLGAEPTPGKGRWEYKAEALPAGTSDADVAKTLEARLGVLTAEGWEFAGWIPQGATFLLRRAR